MTTRTSRTRTDRRYTATYPATPRQLAFIRKLGDERDLTGGQGVFTNRVELEDFLTRSPLTTHQASRLIDWMLALPKRASEQEPQAQAQTGYYVRTESGTTSDREDTDGEPTRVVYVVVLNKAGTATYAKRMEVSMGANGPRGRWVYAPGVGRALAAEGLEPLTPTEAAQLGRHHGACVICGRTLTDPESVARGIGPVCITKLH